MKYAKKCKIKSNNIFSLDTSYKNFILSFKSLDKHTLKNHLQPVQSLYFDQDEKLFFYAINCYAEPSLFNLKWNKNGNFNTFPPTTLAPLDSLLTFEDLNKHISNINKLDSSKVANEKKIKVIILWNNTFRKYSKSLIRLVKNNMSKSQREYEIIYVNNDNFLCDLFLNN